MTTDSERRKRLLATILRTSETKRRARVKANVPKLMAICHTMATESLPTYAGLEMRTAMATALFTQALSDEDLREALLYG